MQQHRLAPRSFVAAALIAAVALSGCSSSGSDESPTEKANPASEYCVEQGGEVEIITSADGETGMCNLPDGTTVDEWEYFRENNPDVSTP